MDQRQRRAAPELEHACAGLIRAEAPRCPRVICAAAVDEVAEFFRSYAQAFVERDLGIPVLHLPQLIGLALGLDFKELGLHRHVVKTDEVQQKVATLAAA